MQPHHLVWFRNDLRTEDNHALFHACQNSSEEGVVAVAAITPEQWLMQDEAHCKIQFWLANLEKIKEDLAALNIPLKVIRIPSNRELPEALLNLAQQLNVRHLYFNDEYPEYEQKRDQQVESLFMQQGIRCHTYDSDVVLPPGSVLNQQGLAYKVFTPFSKAWRQRYIQQPSSPLPSPVARPKSHDKLVIESGGGCGSDSYSDKVPVDIGYKNQMGARWNSTLWSAGADEAHRLLRQFVDERSDHYKQSRDFPAQAATSSLSPYLTAGVLTTRQCIAAMQAYSEDPDWFYSQWITELIWREFYRHLLVAFPEMNRWQPFKPEVEAKISWQYDEKLFRAWCDGETGFDIVDAGMKQLHETGWMHNRVRMISASFLTKLLRQDWRLGARFFMQHLIDGDFASNLGGWQWSASVGADAAPYFRIFSPMRQTDRFDPRAEYIARWLPSSDGIAESHQNSLFSQNTRPAPVIDYPVERNRSIDEYKNSGKQR